MLPISAAELLSLRTELDSTFPDLATVLRPARTSNGRGGSTTTYSSAGTVACIITAQKAGSRNAKKIEQEEQTAVTTWEIKVPQGSDVRVTDRLSVTIGTSTTVYEIFDTVSAQRSQQLALILYARAVE